MNTFYKHLTILSALVLLASACTRSPPIPATPPASLWQGFAYDGDYTIEVDQAEALIDKPIAISISGLRPKQPITLHARLVSSKGRNWDSFATFAADDQGIVEVKRAAPVYGTYTSADAMGLFWSLRPATTNQPAGAEGGPLDPLAVTLTAEANDKIVASAEIRRLLWDETKVIRQPIEQEGLVGTLFYPTVPGPHPTMICLGGSEGGLSEAWAALLASHGYTTLALAYFGVDPLPAELVEIPLEYFAAAIAWLKARPSVDPARVAVMGGSKGAELALLLAATYPQDIRAAIAYKPSSVVWMGLYRNPQSYTKGPKSSWSLNGRPLAFVSGTFTFQMIGLFTGSDVALRSSYEGGLKKRKAVAAAVIPVEKIKGPVLLVSGLDDQVWPSTQMANAVIERLKANNHPFVYEHLSYRGAGHGIGIPCLPTTSLREGGNMLFGGTPEMTAFANADSWPKVLAFLEENLIAGEGSRPALGD